MNLYKQEIGHATTTQYLCRFALKRDTISVASL